MKIIYTLTEEDQGKYLSTNFAPKKIKARMGVMSVIMFFLFLFSFYSFAGSSYIMGSFFLFFALLYFYLIFTAPKKAKKKYLDELKSTGVLSETKTVEASDNELRFTSPSRIVVHAYEDVSNVTVVNDSFVQINFKHADMILIPPSAFSNNDEIIEFVNLIKLNAKIL